ncbi:monovalent cation/H(+) antiporter subunit G [Chakrabartyella piscis]|uniref:cation:proton antiporter n=1 Tax=Chakrabartyella piscis TaxID=2918914 RepID=UPI00295880A7|nr:monovalent cation/H(+) antiporter subunit G [Chakrabartyella piscis]
MREIIAGIFICLGVIVFVISVFGVFRLRYILNKIHSAALGDTLGLALIVIGLIVLQTEALQILKLFFIVLFFWISAPIATHMIAKLETLTNESYEERVKDK